MYRDVAQWAKIRRRILVEGVSQRQVARETGISPKTIRKMLAHPHPQPYGPRSRRYPKLGPHTASVRRMVRENATLPPAGRLSVQAMYERIPAWCTDQACGRSRPTPIRAQAMRT